MSTANDTQTGSYCDIQASGGEQRRSKLLQKSGQEVAKHKSGKLAKSDSRYWLARLFKNAFTRDGERRETADWCIRIARKGRRETFNLETPNKEAAARKAQGIYLALVANGWEHALAAYKPATLKPVTAATVGAWLEAVRATTDFRGTTFTTYCQCLRQIVAEIADVGDQPARDADGNEKRDRKRRIIMLSRFDYRSGGREAWREKVDAQPLAILTPEAVQRWRMAYVARAGNAPDGKRRAENSAVSLMRSARALFSAKALAYASRTITLPDPLPFAGVKLEKRGSTRYVSKIDAATLIAAARAELTGEPFKLFCLGLLCGLRKKEMDALLWSQVDFQSGQIRIEATEHFQPKSEDSIGAVDLDAELLALLRGWKAKATGPFVIESTRAPRYDHSRANYRAARHFETLYTWLRSKGITARKPLHELRKELGALLASQDGIFAAQRVLRHAQISTTAAYYADKKRRITAGLGALLTAPESIPFSPPAPSVPQKKAATRRKAGI
jgi:integrase